MSKHNSQSPLDLVNILQSRYSSYASIPGPNITSNSPMYSMRSRRAKQYNAQGQHSRHCKTYTYSGGQSVSAQLPLEGLTASLEDQGSCLMVSFS